MGALLSPTSDNFVQKTLGAALLAGATTVTLNNTTNIPNLPGAFIVDRIDTNDVETPNKREVITYTGVSGSTLTGLTRNADGSGSDQDHAINAIVEFGPDILWAQSIYDALSSVVDVTDVSVAKLTSPKILTSIKDTNGNELLKFTATASAVNEVTVTNAAAGGSPIVSATGGDTDIGVKLTPKGAGKVEVTANDINLSGTTPNVQVGGADPKRTIYVPASAMFPSSTAGCAAIVQVETATNKVNIKVLDFDGAGTAKEFAEFGIQSPSYWDASTVTVQFVWYATAGSGTVNWEAQGGAFSDDDSLDAAYGTLQEVTDTLLATGDVHITAETPALTIAGTPVAGDWLQFRIARDPNNDTNTSDARLMGVRIRFSISQYNDL